MASQSKRFQTHWTAQFYVAAELTRRGYQVALPSVKERGTNLFVTTPDGNTQFEVEVKGLSAHSFWLVEKRDSVANLYYVLVYLPGNVAKSPQFFVLSGAEMMKKRAEYRTHIESIGGKYRDDMGGINWSTPFPFENRWNILPGYLGATP
jgi:hypothetical protein